MRRKKGAETEKQIQEQERLQEEIRKGKSRIEVREKAEEAAKLRVKERDTKRVAKPAEREQRH